MKWIKVGFSWRKFSKKAVDSVEDSDDSIVTATLTDRYSNDNKIRNYIRIHDPGHSWLEVPAKDVRDAAGVWDAITAYSPLKRHKFYLEDLS